MPTPPWPLLQTALRPPAEDHARALLEAAAELATRFGATLVAAEEGRLTLGAADEPSLDGAVGLLRDERRIRFDAGSPQVAYRETITRRAAIDHSHKRVADGSGEFARVRLVFEPAPRGSGSRFRAEASDGAVPPEFLPGVAEGVERAMAAGLLAGFPVIDVWTTLADGAFHDIDSSPAAFAAAAVGAVRRLRDEGEPVLLEPVMRLEATAPTSHAARVAADVASRRARALTSRDAGDEAVVTALVPLANLFGYANTLRGNTDGQGRYAVEYDHYAEVDAPGGDDREAAAAALRA